MGSLSSYRTLYEVLEVNEQATNGDIKKVYRTLALKYHPDKNPGNVEAERKMRSINQAYKILSNTSYKKYYDDNSRIPISLKKLVEEINRLINLNRI